MIQAEQAERTESSCRENAVIAPILAAAIIVLWAVSLGLAFFYVDTGLLPNSPLAIFTMLWMQFLYCGLFIVTHDACHGTVCSKNVALNRIMGRVAAFLYAGFNFDKLLAKHQAHHRYVATDKDPDYHDLSPGGERFLSWGWNFFKQYLSVGQVFVMMAVAQIFFHVLDIPERNVIQFWIVPALLSALQLFFFGTWLPHRYSKDDIFTDEHQARNLKMPWILSLVTCWHFGYHHTHHLKPYLPWYRLPRPRSR